MEKHAKIASQDAKFVLIAIHVQNVTIPLWAWTVNALMESTGKEVSVLHALKIAWNVVLFRSAKNANKDIRLMENNVWRMDHLFGWLWCWYYLEW